MLHRARERVADPGQNVPRTGYRFDEIRHRSAFGIKVDDKSLLSFLDMKGSRGVHKTEASRAVHNRNDAAKVDRPQVRGVSLHSYHLSQCDLGSRIRDQYPSQVKLL